MKQEIIISNLPNRLYTPEWEDFDNQFEEGWIHNPEAFCLANRMHHKEVVNLAIIILENLQNWESFEDMLDYLSEYEVHSISQKAYNTAAKILYPEEKLWAGDNFDNPDFWYYNLQNCPYAIDQLWITKDWGPYSEYIPKENNYGTFNNSSN